MRQSVYLALHFLIGIPFKQLFLNVRNSFFFTNFTIIKPVEMRFILYLWPNDRKLSAVILLEDYFLLKPKVGFEKLDKRFIVIFIRI